MTAPRHIRAIAVLTQAGGQWVSSAQLAADLGCGKPQVAAAISEARAMGSVAIETHRVRGGGYRIVPGIAPPPAPPRPVPKHQAHRAAIDLLQVLHPAIAEKVRGVALEAGEPAGDAIHRLLEYGIEVHRDLVVHGEHPLQLGRAA